MSALRRALALAALMLLSVTCSDDFGLPPAQSPNVVDTLTMFAIEGTAIGAPSALNLPLGVLVRTDRSADFDVALNFVAEGPVLLPTGAMGFSEESAIRRMTVPFEEVRVAPSSGYITDEPVPVAAGDVFVVRSRPLRCFGNTRLFYYGKLGVLGVDAGARTVTLQVLVDRNCAFRGLEPGLPTR